MNAARLCDTAASSLAVPGHSVSEQELQDIAPSIIERKLKRKLEEVFNV